MKIFMKLFNPFQPSVTFYMEASHLFCRPNQRTGFCLKHLIIIVQIITFSVVYLSTSVSVASVIEGNFDYFSHI